MFFKRKNTNTPPRFFDYEEATEYLFAQLPMYQQIGAAAYKADLENAVKIDKYFGRPHRKFKCIHVAGTNGKGSVSHMLAAILQKAGYTVGLYTSPHLKSFRERIKINGHAISEDAVVSFVNKHWPLMEKLQPSFFELTTAMAFDYFARKKVDIAVLETGMGGRLDATNVVHPLLSIITNIGLDHTEHLGNTLELVAREKAGIIKRRTPVLIGEYDPATAPVFETTAAALSAPLSFAEQSVRVAHDAVVDNLQYFIVKYTDMTASNFRVAVDLLGGYQQKNIATVLAAVDILRNKITKPLFIPPDAVERGLAQAAKSTGLRGRWEIIGHRPLVVCDTGHNAHGLQCTFQQLANGQYKKLHIVFGVVADKDLASILPLMPRAAVYYFTQAKLPRALPALRLAEQCRAAGLQGEVIESVSEALAAARRNASPDDAVYVGGSTFVVAEVLS